MPEMHFLVSNLLHTKSQRCSKSGMSPACTSSPQCPDATIRLTQMMPPASPTRKSQASHRPRLALCCYCFCQLLPCYVRTLQQSLGRGDQVSTPVPCNAIGSQFSELHSLDSSETLVIASWTLRRVQRACAAPLHGGARARVAVLAMAQSSRSPAQHAEATCHATRPRVNHKSPCK